MPPGESPVERAFRSRASFHGIHRLEVSDFLIGSSEIEDWPLVIAHAFDHFCRVEGRLIRGDKLRMRVSYVLQVLATLCPSFRRTETSLKDLRAVLDGGTVEQIRAWVTSYTA